MRLPKILVLASGLLLARHKDGGNKDDAAHLQLGQGIAQLSVAIYKAPAILVGPHHAAKRTHNLGYLRRKNAASKRRQRPHGAQQPQQLACD